MIYEKETIEWITVAVECCSFMEQNKRFEKKEFLDKALLLFPLLYLKSRLVKKVSDDDIEEDSYLEPHVTEAEYEDLKQSVGDILGEHDEYLETFHPDMPLSDAPVIAMISEDMADIYQGLKDMVANYTLDNDAIRLLAVKEGQAGFYDYWGQKLLNGLRAMHDARTSIDENNE